MFKKKFMSGFTLIELLVAITILAILSSIGIVGYTVAQRTARDSKRVQDVQEVQKALEQYLAINKFYPVGGGGDATSVNNMAVTNAYYQNNVPPNDPNLATVNNYQYTYYRCPTVATGGNPSSYIICARLENANKGNVVNAPSDGCNPSIIGNLGTGSYYCLRSISN